MEKKDKIITLLRQQLRKVLQENSAQKQEIALSLIPQHYNLTL